MADVSIIIVNYNTREHLLKCIATALQQGKESDSRVVIVDNASVDGSVEAVKQTYPSVNIISNKQNQGFARAVNQALELNKDSRYHLILNSDAILDNDYLKKTITFMDAHPEAGIVTGQLLDSDGSRQHSFDNFPTLLSETVGKGLLRTLLPTAYPSKKQKYSQPIEVESVIGAAMLVRQKAIDDVELLDEDYFFFLEETDWCFRMRQRGWHIYFLPDATTKHLQGETKKLVLIPAKVEYLNSLYKFFRKHRRSLSYWLVRVIKPFKIILGLIINLLLSTLTLGMARRFRQSVKLYALLALWHLRFCTDKMTLRYKSSPRT